MITTVQLPNIDIAKYKSSTQIIRNITEEYVKRYIFCPICGASIIQYPNNNPCGDFYCKNCCEDYELKSKKNKFGSKIVDGEYNAMIKKINSEKSLNFFFLAYQNNIVIDFFTIPKFFFTPFIIEKRKPLSETARRAGWTVCNILYKMLPDSAKIFYIQNSKILNEQNVLSDYKKISFISQKSADSKGWLLDVMFCIENLNKEYFNLNDVYNFSEFLQKQHPNNNHIHDKIRQQLQILRDKDFIEFVERGQYRLIKKR